MNNKTLNFEEFKESINRGEKRFINVEVEDFGKTLYRLNLEEVVFQNCIVGFDFKECNLRNAVFIGCNLKTISIVDCNLEGCNIADCSIESIKIAGPAKEEIIFGTNYAYGAVLSSHDCMQEISRP